MDPVEMVETALNEATGRWTGADWPHELLRNGEMVVDDYQNLVMCDGSGDCELCTKAREAAEKAEELAQEVLDMARQGDWEEAVETARRIADLEWQFGDDPVWGPFCEAVEDAAEAAEKHATVAEQEGS
jgi:hypothetical protein